MYGGHGGVAPCTIRFACRRCLVWTLCSYQEGNPNTQQAERLSASLTPWRMYYLRTGFYRYRSITTGVGTGCRSGVTALGAGRVRRHSNMSLDPPPLLRWRRCVPPKRRTPSELCGVKTQKPERLTSTPNPRCLRPCGTQLSLCHFNHSFTAYI
jgi:hypothetical protein